MNSFYTKHAMLLFVLYSAVHVSTYRKRKNQNPRASCVFLLSHLPSKRIPINKSRSQSPLSSAAVLKRGRQERFALLMPKHLVSAAALHEVHGVGSTRKRTLPCLIEGSVKCVDRDSAHSQPTVVPQSVVEQKKILHTVELRQV